ncbi:MAG: alcohol dehydrogenase catalytic domain-containing protein [Actinomycetes bacterium]|jgi:threonine dehydrogenase-like Zn-dependent dehydrogenase|nr:alcohol dehydrogenase catalytic domain-containing protein [Actinomycetes bacterium]
MRAVVFDGNKAEYREDWPRPVAAADEALIRVNLAALCSTDREVMRGYSAGFSGVMGHEFVGRVEQAADPLLVGRRVVGEINLSCFSPDCLYCSTGRDHHCENRSTLGIFNKDGCFADYLTLPTRLLHVLPDDMPDAVALFAEPLAAALRIVEQSHISPNQPVAVVGDGRLAYLIVQVLALVGAPLTVFGCNAEKLRLFEPFAVATRVVGKEAMTNTFEVVVDATGNPESLTLAMALTRAEGLLVMKSTYAGNAEINMSEVVVRELTIRGSRCGPFEPALRYLHCGLITLPPVETFAPRDFEAAFKSHAFKVSLTFQDDDKK